MFVCVARASKGAGCLACINRWASTFSSPWRVSIVLSLLIILPSCVCFSCPLLPLLPLRCFLPGFWRGVVEFYPQGDRRPDCLVGLLERGVLDDDHEFAGNGTGGGELFKLTSHPFQHRSWERGAWCLDRIHVGVGKGL